jgi:flagella basal body P-ring formation protein FlgA
LGSGDLSLAAKPVQNPLADLEDAVADAIRKGISQTFSVPAGDVFVKLESAINKQELDRLKQFEPGALQMELLGGGRDVLGGRRLRLTVHHGGQSPLILSVFADSSMLVKLPVASKAIAAGEGFSADNVVFQTSEVRSPPRELLSESTLLGKTAGYPIPVGGAISSAAIRSQAAIANRPLENAVKPRDAVIVTARVGGVTVRLNNATALQGGKPGDLVRVRNESSQNEFTCRVVAPYQVEAVVLR